MGIVVQKFGGTSVGSVERIQHVANIVSKTYEEGNKVVVVVSAMGKSTDELVSLANAISTQKHKREMDMLLTTGEQVSMSLLAMALKEKGHDAISLTGWQAGIETDAIHGSARITNIDGKRIESALDKGQIVIVAGFQGMTLDKEITTLGRGGSDTTAVALAAALKADRCDIYTDVIGVFTTDPRVVKSAQKIEQISYDEMLELASAGAGVIHPRAVEFAKIFEVVVSVRSSMEDIEGTLIGGESQMEQSLLVKGIAFEKEVAKITVHGTGTSSLASIFGTLANNGINVDIIIHNFSEGHETLSFSIQESELTDTLQILADNRDSLHIKNVEFETLLSKVSIIGSGMITNPGVAAKMFEVLEANDVQIKMVSTSEIKVSTVVSKESMNVAVQSLHDAFGLGAVEVVNQ